LVPGGHQLKTWQTCYLCVAECLFIIKVTYIRGSYTGDRNMA